MYDTQLNENIPRVLERMAVTLRDKLAALGREQAAMVGIHSGGVWVAKHLHHLLGLSEALGHVNIAFYRDDFSQIGLHPQVVTPTALPFEVDGRHLVLVDDVLYTGRTIRSAFNELFDYGRPASVLLVVLADRSGRELPIQADVTGLHFDLPAGQHLELRGPDPLTLELQSV